MPVNRSRFSEASNYPTPHQPTQPTFNFEDPSLNGSWNPNEAGVDEKGFYYGTQQIVQSLLYSKRHKTQGRQMVGAR
jgi:hypothetical protein